VGFSVFADQLVFDDEPQKLEKLALYLTRSPIRLGSSRASWARLIRKVFEVDPLLCKKCGAEMKIIAVITEHAVVDRIIRHIQKKKKAAEEPTVPRAPPPTGNLLN